MSEKEIRSILETVCQDLDRTARWAVRQGVRKVVLPSMLGLGLACAGTGCDDGRPVATDGSAVVDAPNAAYGVPDFRPADGWVPPPDAAYGVPDWGPRDTRPADTQPLPPDGEPNLLYSAPSDAGPIPPYMAPDAGPTPDYMAPDGGGPAPLYSAPSTDSGT